MSDDVGMAWPDRDGCWKRIWIDSSGQRRFRLVLVRRTGEPDAVAIDLRKARSRPLSDYALLSGWWVFDHPEKQDDQEDDPL